MQIQFRFMLIILLLALDVSQLNGADSHKQVDLTNVHLTAVPLDFNNVPLTNALGQIGVRIDGGFMLFGVEVVIKGGQEPLVSVRIPPGSSLNDALVLVIHAVPGYTFTTVAPHLVNVFPENSFEDRDDLLNIQVSNLEINNVSPSNFLSNPARFIPELKAALEGGKARGCEIGPGLSDNAPGIRVHSGNLTVRQAMNLVSEVTIASAQNGEGSAFGWVYSRDKAPSKANPAHTWRVHDVWRLPKQIKQPVVQIP